VHGNSGGASSPRATVTGGAWVHAPPQEKKATGGSGSTSSPLLFLAGGEDHRHLQNTQKRNKQVCFSLFCF